MNTSSFIAQVTTSSYIGWFSELIFVLFPILLWLTYRRGWNISHARWPGLFSVRRFYLFSIALLLIWLVMSSPANTLARSYLTIRSIQKILLCMIIPPLLWNAIPFHVMLFGIGKNLRGWGIQQFVRKSKRNVWLQTITQPGIVLLVYAISFMLWHEPSIASWVIERPWANQMMSCILLLTALLFWYHVVPCGPRLHRSLPIWGIFIYLVGVEILNMLAGVTIAFAQTPIYNYYSQVHGLNSSPLYLTVMQDQMLSGGLTWITGSIVYISTIVLILNQFFKKEKGDPPTLSFTQPATGRTIAPGLEHRVYQENWREIEQSQE
ncbi:MAG: cytochrome c oxidase assembly protein [Chloroflexota bacterium]